MLSIDRHVHLIEPRSAANVDDDGPPCSVDAGEREVFTGGEVEDVEARTGGIELAIRNASGGLQLRELAGELVEVGFRGGKIDGAGAVIATVPPPFMMILEPATPFGT